MVSSAYDVILRSELVLLDNFLIGSLGDNREGSASVHPNYHRYTIYGNALHQGLISHVVNCDTVVVLLLRPTLKKSALLALL